MKSDDEAQAAPGTAKPEAAQPAPHPLDVIDLDAISGGRDPRGCIIGRENYDNFLSKS